MINISQDSSGDTQSYLLNKPPNIFDHVDYTLHFKNKSQNNLFEKFQAEQATAFATLVYMVIGTFYFMVSRTAFVIYFPSWFATVNIILVVVGIMLTGWTIVYIKFSTNSCLQKYSSQIERVWYFSVVSSFVLGVAFKAFNGVCDDNAWTFLEKFGCNTTDREISEGYMTICLIFPTILTLVMTGITWNNQLVSLSFSCIGSCAIIYYYEYWDSQILFYMLAPFSFVTLYFNHIQQLKLYLLHEQQLRLLKVNKALAREDHVSEMRHLIGNVAHDMKTPIAGFLSGIETISSLTRDILLTGGGAVELTPKTPTAKLFSHDSLNSDAANKLQSVLSTVENVLHIHSFMLMTINRCVDFAKTSNGDALIPRPTTIDLREVLAVPLRCMREMQDSVRVVSMDIPATLCSHIITDKQWLLDNLLCLLSNAVRYSQNGTEVSIRVSVCRDAPRRRQSVSVSSAGPKRKHTPTPVSETKKSFSFLSGGVRISADRYSLSPVENVDSLGTLDAMEGGLNIAQQVSSEESGENMNSEQHYLHFAVEDTGVGISPDLMESMFNPSFTQAHRQSGGTGLGLYSLAKRIEALGGDYGVRRKYVDADAQKTDSKQNQGTVFWFSIPYRPDKRASLDNMQNGRTLQTKQATSPIQHTHTTSFSGSQLSIKHPRAATNLSAVLSLTSPIRLKPSSTPLNILLVDDSLPILKMCGMLLRRQGHKVTTAENGAEALDRLDEQSTLRTASDKACAQFDVILMDLQMPVMDGLEATDRIRDAERAFANQQHLSHNDSQCDLVVDDVEPISPYTRRGLSRAVSTRFRREDHPHLLIIGVSACDDNDTIQGAFSAGIDAFISKPCTIKTFNETYDKHHKRLVDAGRVMGDYDEEGQ